SSPQNFTPAGPVAFFWADDSIDGMELWVTDGTDAGTRLVADLTPGPDGTSTGPFAVLDAGVVLLIHRSSVFVSDGAPLGTRRVCCATNEIDEVAVLPDGGVLLGNQTALYRLDSSNEGASVVASVPVADFEGALNGKLIFLAGGGGTGP